MRAKSKTGKTSAKRKLRETDAEFQERLAAKYAETRPGVGRPDMFHREMLFLSRGSFQELQAELWELSKALLDARRRGAWYRNTSQCFQYGRPCAYWPICSSGGNPMIFENQYQVEMLDSIALHSMKNCGLLRLTLHLYFKGEIYASYNKDCSKSAIIRLYSIALRREQGGQNDLLFQCTRRALSCNRTRTERP